MRLPACLCYAFAVHAWIQDYQKGTFLNDAQAAIHVWTGSTSKNLCSIPRVTFFTRLLGPMGLPTK